jgi:hypothetical protein
LHPQQNIAEIFWEIFAKFPNLELKTAVLSNALYIEATSFNAHKLIIFQIAEKCKKSECKFRGN